MKQDKTFSIRARVRSIRYAWEGVNAFFDSQHNAIIHFYFTIFVMIAAIFFRASDTELIALVIVAGFVWAAEIFNTAIEKMMDLVSPEKHPKVKFIKDVAAAAVLISAITAIIVGLVIFIPKIF
jgi:diacylglycerol kinase (ATP)